MSETTRILSALTERGFYYAMAHETKVWLNELKNSPAFTISDWEKFSSSWNEMPVDEYMADGGKYRRRRFGVYTISSQNEIILEPHQPHYQGLEYNKLNGGVERWFEPIQNEIATGPVMTALLNAGSRLFEQVRSGLSTADCAQGQTTAHAHSAQAMWRVESHQFRIEAKSDCSGLPTPEGVHRDGVDFVLVLMIVRHNIKSGTTTIYNQNKSPIGAFTLTEPLDAALINDKILYHGVTPVLPENPALPAYRDVLVLTYRKPAET